jgi:MFS family permease
MSAAAPRQTLPANASATPGGTSTATRAFAIAWVCSLAFYFLEYAVRSAPAVMMPELSKGFGVSVLDVSQILGTYYYTYSTTSLICGLLLDRFGAKFVVPAGLTILGVGCMVFALPNPAAGDAGRLLQGAGSAFAFTGAVYLASRGLSAARLATAIGVTQCLGMLGGTVGQLGSAPLIHGGVGVPVFWTAIGFIILAVGAMLLLVTPRETIAARKGSVLSPYRTVLSNPQSYLCGIVAGLLFVPTTIGDMVWGVRFFQGDRLFSYTDAVFAVSMVPLGWVFGCPLIGWIADKIGRRKPALIGGAAVMLVAAVQLVYAPSLVPAWATLFVFGVASGAAMVPYTIIKEVNPDEVKGSATGAINFLTFGVTAMIGPMFARLYGQTSGAQGVDLVEHFKSSIQFWIAGIVVALIVSIFLRETGRAKSR